MAQEQEELDIDAINRAARAQVADEENREKAKSWEKGIHALVMLPVFIGTIIYYDGWFGWLTEVSAWIVLAVWYCICWVIGKITYGIVRANR